MNSRRPFLRREREQLFTKGEESKTPQRTPEDEAVGLLFFAGVH